MKLTLCSNRVGARTFLSAATCPANRPLNREPLGPWSPLRTRMSALRPEQLPNPNRCARVICVAVVCGMLALLAAARAAASAKPNVIIILSDDQGSVDAGCYGAKDLVTPGVDRSEKRRVGKECRSRWSPYH